MPWVAPPTWLEVARHFHTFAGVTLDRVYFLTDSLWRFDIRLDGLEELHRAMDLGRGVLLIGAHVGSFDALRAASTSRPDVTVRVVLDAEHSPALSRILKHLNPEWPRASSIRDRTARRWHSKSAPALSEGALVTMLATAVAPAMPRPSWTFSGAAEFPTAPWQIAAALHVPVVLCVGLYRGGNRYDLHFELIADALRVDRRAPRSEQLQ